MRTNRIASLERLALESSPYSPDSIAKLALIECMVCSFYHMTSLFCNLIGAWKFLSGGPRDSAQIHQTLFLARGRPRRWGLGTRLGVARVTYKSRNGEMGNAEMKKRGNDLEMVDYCIQLQQIIYCYKNHNKAIVAKQMFQVNIKFYTSSVDICSSS